MPRFCAVFIVLQAGKRVFKPHILRSFALFAEISSVNRVWRYARTSQYQDSLITSAHFAFWPEMAPKSKSASKTKEAVEENGKGKRGSRNVKATSYKDLSDSEDEKRKPDTETESEEEKPKKKTPGRKKAPPKRKAAASESEDESDFHSSEDYDDEDERPSRRKAKPVRSLRAAKSASYKDLSDSEVDLDDGGEQSESEDEKPKKKRGLKKGASPKKKAKVSGSEEEDLEDEEEDELEEEENMEDEDEEQGSDLEDKKAHKKVAAPKKTARSKKSAESEQDEDAENEEQESGSEDEEASVGAKKTSSRNSSEVKAKGEKQAEEEELKEEAAPSKKKATLKPDHDMSEGDSSEEEQTEKSSKKRGRPRKNSGESKEEDKEKPPAKKGRTEAKTETKTGVMSDVKADSKAEDKPKLNKTDSDFSSIDFTCDKKTKDGKPSNFKISSWNVAGLKAWVKKNGLDFIKHEQPDILCLQETKCSEKKLPPECKVKGYHCYWLSGEKEGYAGVALLSKEKPIKVDYGIGKEEFDNEGRLITAEFEKFFLVNVYVPNAGQGLKNLSRRMEWDSLFRAYLKSLDEKKPVILTGDMNVSHAEIDLANPKTNTKSAGFTPEEREGMTKLLGGGFVDTFRHLYPDKTGAYSFWTYLGNARSRNTGWRLDYFIFSERLLPALCDNIIRSEVYGSDHCPITLFAHF